MLEIIINSIVYDSDGVPIGFPRLEQVNEPLSWLYDAGYDDILDKFSGEELNSTLSGLMSFALMNEFYTMYNASMQYTYSKATETSQDVLAQLDVDWQAAIQNNTPLAQIYSGELSMSVVPIDMLYSNEVIKKLISKMPKEAYELSVIVNGNKYSTLQKSLDKVSQLINAINDLETINIESFDGTIISVNKADLQAVLSAGVKQRSELIPVYSDVEITQTILQLYNLYFQNTATTSASST